MMGQKPYKPKGLTYKVNLPGGKDRLTEAILYVAEAYKDAARFGLIKLNKVIWRADFAAFAARRVPVTGRSYQRLQFGPAPVEMRPLLNELEQSGTIEIDRVEVGEGKVEQRVVAILPPHNRFFSPSDVEFLDAAIHHYWDKTGVEASDDSHDMGWRTRETGDEMPYELAFLSDQPLEDEALARFVEKAGARRWTSA